ncbi:cell division protein [Pseudomonas taiwanensis]|uniref:AAA family ATPase n=1 Tax=Pseudomonas taiwanensis TaxID=470150 RepID=UPI0015B843DE|nr:AAA family ATPase [Pseudomonas taiwanensis]NWL80769.1 cell division protein [Pseudomonas taiwanensis]
MSSLHADEAYLGHYQFTHDPFAARVPGFKFFPAQRKPVLGQLHHLARYSQLMLVVSGPHGSGKTLLRQALVASTNKQAVQSLVVSARSSVEAGGMLRQIAQGLNVAQADVRSILAQVGQLALTGQEVYLLVDDAEELDDASLDNLLALAEGSVEARTHVFLFGEDSLLARLDALVEGEERFHVIELQPYTPEETREYVAQRLEGAGRGIDVLSDEQVEDIHLQSGGWPGSINQVAHDLMVEAMLAERGASRKSAGGFNLPKKHLLALAVVGIGVIAAWMMQGRNESGAENASATAAQSQGQAPAGQPAGEADSGSPAVEFAGSSQPLPLPLVGEAQPVIREPLAQAAGQGEPEDGPAPEGAATVPPTVTTSAPPQGAIASPVPAAPVEPIASAQPLPQPTQPIAAVPAAPVAAPKPAAPAAAPAAVPSAATKPVATAKPAAAPAQVAKPAEKPVPATAVASTGGASGNGWYSGQAGSHFALQVLGTSSEGSAKAFVQQNGGQYRYFKKQHQGKALYVVTYGSFPSRTAAQAAIKSLPAKVQAGKPWPKTFASIQQEMAR